MSADSLRNPTTRFSSRVADYIKARPRYPASLVELLVKEIGLTADQDIADIGSGTGISAEPFLQNGNTVVCVEPNAEMRAAAEQLLGHYAGFLSVNGTAEQTGLPDRRVSVVLVAQAFHWFDLDKARTEFARILKNDGWVVLAWNARQAVGTPFLERYEALLREFGTDYDQVQQRTARLASGSDDLDRFFFGGYENRVLENCQDLDFDGLTSRLRSASYTPTEDNPRYAPMMTALTRLFEEHARDGTIRIPYDLNVYYGRVTDPADGR